MGVLIGLLLLLGCSPQGTDDGTVAAKVGDRAVSVEEVERVWSRLDEDKRPSKQEILQALVDRHILYLEAQKRGLPTSAAVEQKLADEARSLEIERLLERQVDERVEVTEEEVRAYYDSQGLAEKRRVRGRHIMLGSAEAAEAVYRKILDGADFAEMARQHSVEAQTRDKGGDMGFWDETLMIGPVSEELFALDLGQVSPPFIGKGGYFHILKVEEEQPITYEHMRSRIQNRFREKRLHERKTTYYNELIQRYDLAVESQTLLRLIQLNKTATHGLARLEDEADRARTLITYDGGEVSLPTYLRWVSWRRPNLRPVSMDTASMALFARRTAVDSLLLPAAAAGGVDQEEMDRFLKRRREELAIETLHQAEAEDHFVNDEILFDYYGANLERYSEAKMLQYEAMLLHTEAEARGAAARVRSGEDMWAVAQEFPRFYDEWRHYGAYHIDLEHTPSAEAARRLEGEPSGEIPQMDQHEVLEAIALTPVGQVGGPYEVTFKPRKDVVWKGFMIYHILAQRPPSTQSFDNPVVRQELKKLVKAPKVVQIEERFEAFVTQLRQEYAAQVQTYPDRLDQSEGGSQAN